MKQPKLGSAFDFSAVAKRIPFKCQSHMSGENEHRMMHWNEPLNIACETITTYRNGKPWKSKRWFYVNERKSKTFQSLTELLNESPLLGQLAEATYFSKKEAP
jgi:hypothetical protein